MRIVDLKRPVAQGDLLFRRVSAVPAGAQRVERKGPVIVGHSETGHHHVIEDPWVEQFEMPANPLVCYLQIAEGVEATGGVDVIHKRAWDTHEPYRLLGQPGDVIEVRRQREHSPEGWRRVAD